VQPTGSGKSSVPQTASVVTSGVTFIIECTQSLGSDQASKIKQATTSNGALVYAHQLDLLKTNDERNALATNIHTVMSDKKHSSIENGIVSFILFTSPEALLHPTWSKLLDDMISMEMITLFCIDEVHLFVEFGLSFRKSFLDLRKEVFAKLLIRNCDVRN
jgi:superfamily II DNA helicase RecQ